MNALQIESMTSKLLGACKQENHLHVFLKSTQLIVHKMTKFLE